jgi:hypothetical protein
LGKADGTSLDRANALKRLGHRVDHVDPLSLLPRTPWVHRITWRVGGQVFSPWVLRTLPRVLQGGRFDLCYVDSGEWVTPKVVDLLRTHSNRVVNYIIDDPFGARDAARFTAYRRSVPFYDLCVVVRTPNEAEAKALGAKDVLRVFMSSDEVSHAPRTLTGEDLQRWKSDVLFLGTWMPERGPFLLQLIKAGVPLTIRGANWSKAPEWPALRSAWQGGALRADDYAKAVQCAGVNLGLLSKGNRDLHTTRSLEIPALGGVLCAERTSEHSAMYVEGKEAVFWSDAAECAAQCLALLSDEAARQRLAVCGHARHVANAIRNEAVMSAVLERAMK